MDPGVKAAVFTGMTLDVDRSVPGVPKLTATVGVTNDESMIQRISNDFEPDGNNKYLSNSFRIRIIANDGSFDSGYVRPYSIYEKISGKFITTGPIEVPVNETGKERYFTAELYLDNGLTFKEDKNPTTEELESKYDPVIRKVSVTVDGQEVLKDTGIESAALASMKYVTKDDITVGVSVRVSDESSDYVPHQDENGEYILADDNPVLRASFDLKGDGYDFGDISNVTVYDYDASGNKSLHDSTAHFVWESSAPNIADINANGTISIKNKSGTATFYLTALNGGKVRKDSNGHNLNVIVKAGEFRFVGSNNPFLKVDDVNYIHIASGPSLTVQMSTNLNEKVSSGAAFNIEVFRGSDTSVQPEYSDTLVVAQNESLSRVIIPSEALAYDYSLGATNDFKIRISTTYENELYEGFARVTVESPPAVVRLGRLQDYYILDSTGTLGITWEINNFDRFASGNPADLFELSIKKDGVEIVEPSYKNAPGSVENGHCSGLYVLPDLSFNASSDRNGYRQIYDVSIKAKNGAESTWSTDSCLIYVYDADALKIWIQPTSDIEKKRGTVGTQITGSGSTDASLTMSNVSTISNMTQDQIIALRRDISLRNVISANYGEYAWTELADQLEWASSNNGVASINYKQGDIYEDISKNLAKIYTSYRPATDFLVSGLSDGETNITAKHVLTGMTDTLTVDVETLKDKLYLFQCYPQVETTLTYTDKQGNTTTVTSDANGAAAIYDPEGIGSDVYCRSTFEGHVYLGTFFNKDLESGERDSTKLELYPCNNVKLRRAAYAYVYVKNADGTPYNGYILVRGGVNVNGSYVSTAKFAFNSTEAATR
ncbi:MAG: hypothetical protein J6T50_04125, partial [Lachnospiraceae bacterium]|nr:hypothetical protein [Lachnospiraceae bacterium]